MKLFRSLLVSFFLVVTLPLSVQAAPPMGTYPAPESFPPGTWAELLKTGLEGNAGNIISAQSSNYFLFKDAVIAGSTLPEQINPAIDCQDPALEFKTVYQDGSLTLYNPPTAPWHRVGDPPSYAIALPIVNVTTCKYLDQNGEESGEISFFLKSKGIITAFPGYTVEIEAKYRGKPLVTSSGADLIMGDHLDSAKIIIKGPVAVDIKPGSCPNPVNVKSQGVLPVAILGGPNFNVLKIDPATITLGGVPPLRWALEDVATPFSPLIPKDDRLDCNTGFYDGFPDLTLKFETQDLVSKLNLSAAEDRSVQVWTLRFKLKDGTELSGSDVVWILNKPRNDNKGNRYGRIRHKGY